MFSRKPKTVSTGWMKKYARTGIEPRSDDSNSDDIDLNFSETNRRIKVVEFNQTKSKFNKDKKSKEKKSKEHKKKEHKKKKSRKTLKVKKQNNTEYLMESSED